jgi:hypothetical protein
MQLNLGGHSYLTIIYAGDKGTRGRCVKCFGGYWELFHGRAALRTT